MSDVPFLAQLQTRHTATVFGVLHTPYRSAVQVRVSGTTRINGTNMNSTVTPQDSTAQILHPHPLLSSSSQTVAKNPTRSFGAKSTMEAHLGHAPRNGLQNTTSSTNVTSFLLERAVSKIWAAAKALFCPLPCVFRGFLFNGVSTLELVWNQLYYL